MSKISLRAYNREIETMIESGRIEEAIAHCRHILKSFPKHVETYRLLGKGYLESQRYSDAADILQRVLSAVPEDFVSHLGMSIIREDEGNLDEAIWHMERAFEVQPANGAIQDELRRLYGRRDGLEPPKVRLTRGALARMYSKGDLNQQAIAELRAALSEDSQRFDLQVLLARVYLQAGLSAEAADTCSEIVRKLPFCLEANRILAVLTTGSERNEEAELYRKRVQALDPYAAHAPNATTPSDKVPDQAISLEKLDWKAGRALTAGSGQPEWAASLGVELDDMDTGQETLPEWLTGPVDTPPPPHTTGTLSGSGRETPSRPLPPKGTSSLWDTSTLQPKSTDLPPAQMNTEENIPEWMKAAGWGPSTGAFDESASVFSDDEDEEDSAPVEPGEALSADIPDWLRSIAPPNADPAAEVLGEPAGSDEPADTQWLDGVLNATAKEGGPTHSAPAGDIPDWLEDKAENVPGWQNAAMGAASENAFGDVPDWLQSIGGEESPATPAAAPAADIPDWLKDLSQEAPSMEDAFTPPSAQPPVQSEPAPATDVPDWLQDLGQDAPATDELSVAPAAPAPAAADIPDWMQSLGSAETAAPAADVPDWLQDLGQDAPVAEEDTRVQPEAGEEPAAVADNIPDWMPSFGVEESQPAAQAPEEIAGSAPAEPAADMPDWLKDLSQPAPSMEEAVPAEPELTPAADVPDWLKDLGQEAPTAPAPEEILPEAADGLAGESAAEPEAEPAADLPDWLKALGQEAPSPEESLPAATYASEAEAQVEAEPAAMAADVPDWLNSMSLEESEPEPESMAPAADIPSWLKDLSQEAPSMEDAFPGAEVEPEPELESEPAAPVSDLPDWLKDLSQTAPSMEEAFPAGEPAAEFEPEPEPQLAVPTDDMPDWLKDLSQPAPSAEEAFPSHEPAAELAPEPEPEPIALVDEPAAELAPEPEVEAGPVDAQTGQPSLADMDADAAFAWLESLAVQQGATEALLLTPEERQDTPPDWVAAEAAAEPAVEELVAEEPGEEEPVAPAAADIPDWLKEMSAEAAEPQTNAVEASAAFGAQVFETAAMEEELPTEAEATPASDIPDWLLEINTEMAPAVPEEMQPEAGSVPEPEMEQPVEEPVVAPPAAAMPEAVPPAPAEMDADAAFAWLESLAVQQGATEALLLQPEERQDTPPDWVAAETASAAEAAQADEMVFGAAPLAQEPVAEQPALGEAAAGEVQSEPLAAEIPDWLKEMTAEESGSLPPEAEVSAPAETQPETELEQTSTPVPPAAEAPAMEDMDADAAFAWLESLAVRQGADEALLLAPEERRDTPPEWVSEIPADIEARDEDQPEEPPAAPEWMEDFASELEVKTEAEVEPEPEPQPMESVPEWLSQAELVETPTEPEPQPAAPAQEEPSAPPAEMDLDAALAWMEALAVKQGATEALLTDPSQRQEAPPDWVAAETAAAEAEAVAAETQAVATEAQTAAAVVEEPAAEIEPEPSAAQVFESPAWLAGIEAEVEAAAVEPVAAAPEAAPAQKSALDALEEEEEIIMGDTKPVRVKPAVSEIPPESAVLSDQVPPVSPVSDVAAGAPVVDTPPTFEPEVAETVAAQAAAQEAVQPPAQEPSAPPAEMDLDAALAWMEALAVKQGATEALLTDPSQRQEAPPDWVAAETAAAEAEAVAAEVQAAAAAEFLAEEPAADAAVVEEPAVAPEAAPAAPPVDEVPAWLQDLDSTPAAPSAAGLSEVPDWLKEEAVPAPVVTPPAAAPPPITPPPAVEPARADTSVPDLPDWLAGVQAEPTEEPEWVPPKDLFRGAPLDINKASLAELERLPGIGFILAQRIVSHRERFGAFREVEELLNVPGFSRPTLAFVKGQLLVQGTGSLGAPAATETTAPAIPAGQSAPVTPSPILTPADAPIGLRQGRDALNQGHIDEALQHYDGLIRSRQFIEEVIRDLSDEAYRRPNEVALWQYLGDAYMRNEQLQEALDAYTRAEELLR